jgi:hypothetical protein
VDRISINTLSLEGEGGAVDGPPLHLASPSEGRGITRLSFPFQGEKENGLFGRKSFEALRLDEAEPHGRFHQRKQSRVGKCFSIGIHPSLREFKIITGGSSDINQPHLMTMLYPAPAYPFIRMAYPRIDIR